MKALLIALALTGCGGGESTRTVYPNPNPSPNPSPSPNPGRATFANTIKPLLDSNCALSGCHSASGFLGSERAFLKSKSKARIGNGTMPPQYSPRYSDWTQREKSIFASYFDSQ